MVINRAVACSGNSRNGIFDLPITPGEQLEVIDTTEQNLVICRNSKGKCEFMLRLFSLYSRTFSTTLRLVTWVLFLQMDMCSLNIWISSKLFNIISSHELQVLNVIYILAFRDQSLLGNQLCNALSGIASEKAMSLDFQYTYQTNT